MMTYFDINLFASAVLASHFGNKFISTLRNFFQWLYWWILSHAPYFLFLHTYFFLKLLDWAQICLVIFGLNHFFVFSVIFSIIFLFFFVFNLLWGYFLNFTFQNFFCDFYSSSQMLNSGICLIFCSYWK